MSINNFLINQLSSVRWLRIYKTVSWQLITKDFMKYCLFDTRLRWSVKLYSSWFLYIVMWITKHKIHRPKILIQNLPVKQTVKEKWSTITFLTSLQITIRCVSTTLLRFVCFEYIRSLLGHSLGIWKCCAIYSNNQFQIKVWG